jgi:hypothetical protein
VSFDLAAGGWILILLVGAMCGGLGVLGIVAAFTGRVVGGSGVRIGVIVLSLIFFAIALAPLAMLRVLTRPRKLIIEPDGIRWDDPRGKPWYVPWSELAGVSISTASKLKPYGFRTTLARVDLFPGDAGFQARHPELAHLWEVSGAKQSYRLPLGPHERYVRELDRVLQAYAQTKYRGVIDEGVAWGFRYT